MEQDLTDIDFDKIPLYREIERLRDIINTGISGYCGCCGAPNYINIGISHNRECIWFVAEE